MYLSDLGKRVEKYWMEIPGHFKNVDLGEFVVMPNRIHGILILVDGIVADGFVETLHCNVSNDDELDNQRLHCNVSNDDESDNQTLHCNVSNEINGINIEDQTLHCNVSTTDQTESENDGQTNPTSQFMSDISPKSGSVSTIIRSYKSVCTKYANIHNQDLNFGWQSRFHDHVIRNETEYQRIANYIVNNPRNWKNDKFYLYLQIHCIATYLKRNEYWQIRGCITTSQMMTNRTIRRCIAMSLQSNMKSKNDKP